MADGVVMAWGCKRHCFVPVRQLTPSEYAVADYAGLERLIRPCALRSPNSMTKPPSQESPRRPETGGLTHRSPPKLRHEQSHDYHSRSGHWPVFRRPAGVLPFTRFNFLKVKPGKGGEFRKAWEKYNKPVFDKLLADGVVVAYGLAVEEIRTNGEFTHFVWYDVKDLASFDKVRAAFIADRDRRSQEEQDSLTALFVSLQDVDASRSAVNRSLILHVPGAK